MTPPGRLIAVVGPSGVGKDSVMEALARARPELRPVRRVITRSPGGQGEAYEAVSEAEFARRQAAGAFCLDWQAHGLCYGIPADLPGRIAAGEEALVNLSRGVLAAAQALFPRFTVLTVTARPETIAARLKGRGRESAEDIARRLDRAACPPPAGVDVRTLPNDGPLAETVALAIALLYPEPADARP